MNRENQRTANEHYFTFLMYEVPNRICLIMPTKESLSKILIINVIGAVNQCIILAPHRGIFTLPIS